MDHQAKIYVAGGQTLIGAALVRELKRQGYTAVVGGTGEEPTLTEAASVEAFFAHHAPEYVFMAAGKSGGIRANQKFPAELMLDNLLVNSFVIDAAYRHGVRKLLYLASSCSYPRLCPQPMQVESLLSGPLEPTNEAYAVAKIAGLKLCQAYRQQHGVNFIVGIPANAFGPGDDFSPEDSHVIGALLRRFHAAKLQGAPAVTVWGTGAARREFIFVDDLAQACLVAMQHYEGAAPLNLGSGQDYSIRQLAELIQAVVGFTGQLQFDIGRSDGMPEKRLDSTELAALGWRPITPFRDALAKTFGDYLETQAL